MNRWPTTKFDLREVDFDSGKRLPLPNDMKINCDCCGRKIAKGFNTNDGMKIGTECANTHDFLRQYRQKGITQKAMAFYQVSMKQVNFFGIEVVE